MLRTPKTAHEICWCFAIACREEDVIRKRLTRKECQIILKCAKEQKHPPNHIIVKAFTRPFQTLTKLGLEWTYENMLRYWLEMHDGPLESTPVRKVKVLHTGMYDSPYISQVALDNNETMFVDNIHRYDLQNVKHVYIHGYIIALCA